MQYIRIMDLFDRVIKACSDCAKNLEGFMDGDGAVRLCYLPQSSYGRNLLGDFSTYADRYELVSRICDGNFVLNRHDRDAEPVDTYAFSALKVASCLVALERGLPARSGENIGNSYNEMHGFAPYKGAILYMLSKNHHAFAMLAVAVSGATQDEDEMAALASEETIRGWCKKNHASYDML
ncbi:MAG: hypothetical protein Q4D22_03285 [Candidatus Saccharibacteria bacterium]|nr:hypothetical protein [Candidatus Saccharibacteria bacterium]